MPVNMHKDLVCIVHACKRAAYGAGHLHGHARSVGGYGPLCAPRQAFAHVYEGVRPVPVASGGPAAKETVEHTSDG